MHHERAQNISRQRQPDSRNSTPIAYTPEQAAAATGRSRSRIFKAIKDKELTARKDGKATILEDNELRRWVRTFPAVGRESVL
jgi:hypothetical protein